MPRQAVYRPRQRCPRCNRRLARPGGVSGRRLVREFKAGRSVIGLARRHAVPVVVVEERIRRAARR